ncbi:MAG: tryptophan synthase subunit beta [Bacteroidetes bacterium]|nr:tryptophan synthase subunit beta [Bacteroidota bacterium]
MSDTKIKSIKEYVLDSTSFFGEYGGSFIPEVIKPNLDELTETFMACIKDESFERELRTELKQISGRPTAFTPLPNLTEKIGGAQLWFKNEGLNHTGAHKINHCIGQALVAKRLGKKRIIAETGAGQHGLATATVCARYQMDCVIYMGRKDYNRQRPNVFWMELLGATVIPVDDGSQTLSDAVIAAFKDLISNPEDTHYLLGSAVGPHPYPLMNTYFQKIIGEEVREQTKEQFDRLPDCLVACVGGGSNALGLFFDFLDDRGVEMIGVEAGGRSTQAGDHAAKLLQGEKGIFEGYYSYFLQDGDGNISDTHSVSAGLDYCGVSPILAYLKDTGRVKFEVADDKQALTALEELSKAEGFIPALESAHAFAYAFKYARELSKDKLIVINSSGRGEKDLFITMEHFQKEGLTKFLKSQLNGDGS